MPTEAVILFAALAACFGSLAVIAVGARCTRNLRCLGWGGVCSGAALGTAAYFSLHWIAYGFEPLQAWIVPLAGLVLLLVMVAQNWFVFYEDREDLLQSARPTLAMLSAAAALSLAAHLGEASGAVHTLIWAAATSAVLVLSIHPVNRSIAANGGLAVGILVGTAKLLVPAAGLIALLAIDRIVGLRRATRESLMRSGFWVNLLPLLWELGQLLLVTLTNGARFVPHQGPAAAADLGAANRRGESAASQIPLSRRNTAVLMLVVALHLLCGLILARN